MSKTVRALVVAALLTIAAATHVAGHAQLTAAQASTAHVAAAPASLPCMAC